MKRITHIGCILLSLLFIPTVAYPQVGKLLREVSEAILEKTGKEEIEAFAEFGGEAATKELLEKAIRQGGEELATRTVAYVQRYGVDALKILSEDPKAMVQALDSLPSSLSSRAISEGARSPSLITKVVRQHGNEALRLSAEHPGVGLQVVDTYGQAGINAARNLSTDELILLTRQTSAFQKLPASAKQQFTDLLSNDPKTVLAYLAGGTGIVITAKAVQNMEEILVGSPDEPGPLIKPIIIMAWILGAVLLLLLVGYFTPKIWGNFQRERFKTAKEDRNANERDKSN